MACYLLEYTMDQMYSRVYTHLVISQIPIKNSSHLLTCLLFQQIKTDLINIKILSDLFIFSFCCENTDFLL
ncbi:hypothetical protein YA45_17615 [Enterobacter hormaechei subsp. steigerwaltii]|nr:hypothetical protein YA45_17615 [Enterobacter hormaechei subsp. steigerwaltii]